MMIFGRSLDTYHIHLGETRRRVSSDDVLGLQSVLHNPKADPIRQSLHKASCRQCSPFCPGQPVGESLQQRLRSVRCHISTRLMDLSDRHLDEDEIFGQRGSGRQRDAPCLRHQILSSKLHSPSGMDTASTQPIRPGLKRKPAC